MQTDQIDGTTRLFAIIGDPIFAVRSPAVFNSMFARQGINAVLVPLHVAANDLDAAWEGIQRTRNLAGLIVTMPHKAAMARKVDELGPTASVVGAVNAVKRTADGRWIGDMFDGVGCVEAIIRRGWAVAGRSVFLLGAGSAGSAIAAALATAGVARLAITDADSARRDGVIAAVSAAYPGAHLTAGTLAEGDYDIAINATPLGMKSEDPLPFDPAMLPRSTLIVDVVTKPEFTALLTRARERGHPVQTGRHMHEGQAIGVARFFGFELEG
jgi:shikimate dehydrogenase